MEFWADPLELFLSIRLCTNRCTSRWQMGGQSMTTADNSSAAADWISVGMASGENPTNHGESKEKALFAAVANKALFSEVDGARTRNHRIDSPVL